MRQKIIVTQQSLSDKQLKELDANQSTYFSKYDFRPPRKIKIPLDGKIVEFQLQEGKI